MLTIEQIRAAQGPSQKAIHVEEWGGDLLARRLGKNEFIQLSKKRPEDIAGEGGFEYMKSVIKMSIITEDGQPFFTDENEDILDTNPMVVASLGAKLIEFNGMNREEAKKNLPTQPGDSPSGSA